MSECKCEYCEAIRNRMPSAPDPTIEQILASVREGIERKPFFDREKERQMTGKSDFTITVPNGPSSLGTEIKLNGQTINNVTAVEFEAHVDKVVKVRLEVYATSVEIEGHGEVQIEVRDRGGAIVTTDGFVVYPTRPDAQPAAADAPEGAGTPALALP